jgi:predicted nucleic acid-binding protein
MIIVDTTIWSKAYRRKQITEKDQKVVDELNRILDEYSEILIGPVRQELLSGISNNDVFEDIKEKLDNFNNYIIQLDDHDRAAEYFNICQRHGIQGSLTDYLICAVANKYNLEIFTADNDFKHYKKYLPIRLYQMGNDA